MSFSTPWGKSDYQRRLADGAWVVSTPGHGGIGIAEATARRMLRPETLALGDPQGGYFWYEEDCAYCLPRLDWPELGEALVRNWRPDDGKTLEESFLETASYWYLPWVIATGRTPDPKGAEYYNAHKKQDEMRAAKHPDLIISAESGKCTIDGFVCPDGSVRVTTADRQRHLVTAESYNSSRCPNLLSDCIEYSGRVL